jgi:hypothetical protein
MTFSVVPRPGFAGLQQKQSGQKQHVGIDEALTDARIRRTSPTDCDGVLDMP